MSKISNVSKLANKGNVAVPSNWNELVNNNAYLTDLTEKEIKELRENKGLSKKMGTTTHIPLLGTVSAFQLFEDIKTDIVSLNALQLDSFLPAMKIGLRYFQLEATFNPDGKNSNLFGILKKINRIDSSVISPDTLQYCKDLAKCWKWVVFYFSLLGYDIESFYKINEACPKPKYKRDIKKFNDTFKLGKTKQKKVLTAKCPNVTMSGVLSDVKKYLYESQRDEYIKLFGEPKQGVIIKSLSPTKVAKYFGKDFSTKGRSKEELKAMMDHIRVAYNKA